MLALDVRWRQEMAGRAASRRPGAPWLRGLPLIAALVSLAAGAAAAQDEPLLERQYLTGDWNGVRPLLSSHGFQPYLTYTGTLWSNLAGGNDTGAQVNGYLDFGLDLDLAKLGAWDGLGFHADVHWWQGVRPTNTLIGGLLAMALSDWEAADTFRVFNLYFRQAFDDDRLVFKIGQIAADTDFMVSRYGGVFLNAAFGDLPSQNLNLDAPVYPLAGPGVFAAAKPMSWLTGRFGAYTGEAGNDVAGNHGFGWGLGNNAGYTFFSELAATAPDGSPPATYTLGGIYDTGGSAQFGTGVERRVHYELYLMVDQALLADDHGDPVLGVFARITGSPQDTRNVVGLYADGGVAAFGLVPWRPKDVLGAAVSVVRFTNDFQQQEQMAGTPVGSGETVLEVTYQVAIAPWLVVQPDAQFFFNPAFSRRDAQALGGELVAIF
jgi:porin